MGAPKCWHPEGCDEYAAYETVRGSQLLCENHATEALDAGKQVYGPNGHFCRLDRDRLEIVEVSR